MGREGEEVGAVEGTRVWAAEVGVVADAAGGVAVT